VGPIERQSDRSLMEANIDALVRNSKQTVQQEIDEGTITHTGTRRADGRMPVNVNEEDLLSTPRASNRTKLSLAVSPTTSTRRQLETLEFSIDQEGNNRVYAVVKKKSHPLL
jgi:hypothetical protein